MGNRATRNDPKANCDSLGNPGKRRDSAEYNNTSTSRQASTLSLGNLSGRNSSKSNYNASSLSLGTIFRRNKSSSKSLTSSLRYPKTTWPTPLTDTIFLSHFKKLNRNNDFKIKDIIAKGAFGNVIKVVNKNEPNVVHALKVLKKSKIIDENCVKQIKEEVDIQKQCGHFKFIVKQIDTWQSRRHLYILSEYIPNGELLDKIWNIPIDLVRLYVAEISLALDFLHNAGIIYRDVKPENILLTADYHIQLTDFGFCKWLRRGDKTKTWCGTTQYMAPEILRGEAYGHEVDWWSLGIVACLMLTNQYPNTQAVILNESQMKTSSINPQLVPNEDALELQPLANTFFPSEFENVSKEGKDLLKRLLEFNPKIRLKSVMALQRIAFYMNYKIDIESLLKISPMDIYRRENIDLNSKEETSPWDDQKSFEYF